MTNIRCDNDREEYTIDIEGHSLYNPGNDIVCGACSILMFTLINTLQNQPTEEYEINGQDGEMHIKVKGMQQSSQEIRTIINTIMSGYELLEEEYPDHVTVEW